MRDGLLSFALYHVYGLQRAGFDPRPMFVFPLDSG
jgi:hypothetical protein